MGVSYGGPDAKTVEYITANGFPRCALTGVELVPASAYLDRPRYPAPVAVMALVNRLLDDRSTGIDRLHETPTPTYRASIPAEERQVAYGLLATNRDELTAEDLDDLAFLEDRGWLIAYIGIDGANASRPVDAEEATVWPFKPWGNDE